MQTGSVFWQSQPHPNQIAGKVVTAGATGLRHKCGKKSFRKIQCCAAKALTFVAEKIN
jgi:hypothetical protein